MKLIKSIIAMAAVMAAMVGYAGDSAPFRLDTVTPSTSPAVSSLSISWDASWVGGDTNATVVIADNGTELKSTTGVGTFMYTLTSIGRNEFTYTTYIGGVAQAEVYRVSFYAPSNVVTFAANGGNVGEQTRPVLRGAIVGNLPMPTRTGYTFAGWWTEESGGTRISAATVPDGNVTYYAHWSTNQQLWEDGPYWATTNIGADNPEDAGYYFWWGDTVGYKRENAKWVATDGSSSNFSFDTSNAPTCGKDIATLQSEGWITADGVLAPEHDAARVHWGCNWRMPTDAEFSALTNNCTTTWTTRNGVYGRLVTGKGAYADRSIFLPAVGCGYGSDHGSGSYGYYWSSTPTSDNSYNAWDLYFRSSKFRRYYNNRYYGQSVRPVQGYVVTFNANGGTGETTRTILPGATVGALPTPMREGYTFTGWWTAASGGTQISASTTVTGDVTYYAHWTVNQYTVTFNANGGTGGKSAKQDYGSAIVAPTVTRTGYTFRGWQPVVLETVPASNVTYTAQWQINQYTATFNANGGTGGTTKTQDYGSAIVAPTVTRTGYTFRGWSPSVPSTMPAGNTTYTAQWKINQYTVTFNANGGTGGTTKTQNYGTAIVAPVVTREWFNYAWSPAVAATVPASNVTYVAQWWRWGDSISASEMGGKTMSELYPDDYMHMTTVVLEEGITELPEGFFDGCGDVEFVTWPSTLLEFGIDDLPPKIRAAVEGKYDEDGFLIYNNWILDYENRSAAMVTIPEGIVGIGRGTFAEMFDLETVEMPESLRCIAKEAFKDSSWIQEFQFMSGLRYVGPMAFSGCSSLLWATFADGVGYIGTNAFENCWQMQSVRLPSSVTNIGANAFSGCGNIRGVTVPTQIKTMQQLFPASYAQIETAEVADGETAVMDDMFAGCVALRGGATQTDMSMIPNTVTNIGARAFQGCSSLTAFVVPDSVTEIGVSAFQNCTNLWNVTLSRNLSAITNHTFYGCSRLETMVVPEKVNYLGERFFSGTSGDNALYYLCTNAPACHQDAYAAISGGMTTYVLQGSRSWDGRQGSRVLPQLWNGYPITYWTPNRFDVTFDANGGRFELADGSAYTWNEQQITDTAYALPSTEPIRPGWAFEGWWTEQTGGAEVRYTTRVTATRQHTLYAHWRSLGNRMTVTFNSNGGTVVVPGTQDYVPGQTFGQFPVPTRRGYLFIGWYRMPNMPGETVTEETVVGDNVTWYAHWVKDTLGAYVSVQNLFLPTPYAGTNATWTVQFDPGQGELETVYRAMRVERGKKFGVLPVPTRAGYAFVGWRTTPEQDGRVTEGEEVPAADMELFAHWMPITYYVRFNPNGGTGSAAHQMFLFDEQQSLCTHMFERTGFAFTGWATTPSGQVRYPENKSVVNLEEVHLKIVDLYARWSGVGYSVRFDSNGGTGIMDNQTIAVGETQNLWPCVFARGGYKFAGWAMSPTEAANGTVKYRDGAAVKNLATSNSATVPLYAVWLSEDLTVRISFDANGGSVSPAYWECLVGTAVEAFPTPTRPGYTFAGWWTAKTGGTQVESIAQVTTAQTFYAHWTENGEVEPGDGSCKVTFNANGGSVTETERTVNGGSAVGELPTPARTGHAFLGWFTAAEGGVQVFATTIVSGSVTYYAQWALNQYTATFNANGGSGGTSVTQDYGTTLIAPTVTRIGYTFTGWSPSVPLKMPDENVTYFAQWHVNQYTMTFDANGGEGGTDITQDYGTAIVAPTVTQTGYTLAGWSPSLPATVQASNATYTAQWQINQHMVTFDANGGIGGVMNAQDYASEIVAPDVSREGYTFVGWSPEVDGTVPDSNVTYIAQWRVNQYTMTFDANGGEGGTDITQDYGTAIVAPTVTLTGYTLAGWSPSLPATVPASNVTYTAQWQINQYIATFDANGGTGGKSVTQNYGTALSAPTVTRTGYAFTGWSPSVPSTMPAANKTYTAQWQINQYTATFDANGGTGGKSVTQNYGTALSAPTVTRTGYAFTGWSPSVPSTMPAANKTYTAQWQINQYTVTFDANGGEGGASTTQNYDAVIVAPTVTREGYTFLGWATNATGEVVYAADQPLANLTTEPDGAVTLYAVWQEVDLSAPVISPADGTMFYDDTCEVTITCATAGTTIYYSTNGRTPRFTEAYRYAGPFTITDTTTVIAVAVLGDSEEYAEATITKGEKPPLTLEGVLDASNLSSVTTSGDAEWIPVEDESAKVGGSCAQSGVVGMEEVSHLEVTVSGKGTLTFWWKVSCEPDPRGRHTYDNLSYSVDGTNVAWIDGERDWAQQSVTFDTDGAHTVRWTYSTDDWEESGYSDCGWVDGVVWTPEGGVVVDPLPEIASDSEVTNALAGAGDEARLMAHIGNKAQYDLFRAWVDAKGLDHKTAKDSPRAWFSYAIGANGLVEGNFQSGDVEVASVEAPASGVFTFKVRVKNAPIGSDATAANLATVFEVQGSPSLAENSFSSKNVNAVLGVSADGQLIVSATPIGNFNAFFVRVRMYADEEMGDGDDVVIDPVGTTFSVTFDANGGEGGWSRQMDYGATIVAPTVTRTGYAFTGWSPEVAATVPASNVTYTAQWATVVDTHDKVQLWEGGPYWATTNIGAENPEDAGYFFWWGDTIGYRRENDAWVALDGSSSNFSFSSSNTPTDNKYPASLENEGWITADGVLAPEHDAAHVHWGGAWRMPTQQELDDLNSNCDWTWTTVNGVNGYLVCGRGDYASNSIFLPAGGEGSLTSFENARSGGYYWSSVPRSNDQYTWSLSFSSSYHTMSSNWRDDNCRTYGRPVRPVRGFAE